MEVGENGPVWSVFLANGEGSEILSLSSFLGKKEEVLVVLAFYRLGEVACLLELLRSCLYESGGLRICFVSAAVSPVWVGSASYGSLSNY